jgi:hypothetical protein
MISYIKIIKKYLAIVLLIARATKVTTDKHITAQESEIFLGSKMYS